MTILSARDHNINFGPGQPTMLINDQLYVLNKPRPVIEELIVGNTSRFIELAIQGINRGMDMTAILITHPEIDEVSLLPRLAREVHEATGCPVGLDTRNIEAIEATLAELQPYKSIIWTVTAESKMLAKTLPIAKKYGAVVAGMPMGQISLRVPMTAKERIDEAKIILAACEGYGIPAEDVVIDAVCMPAALLEPQAFRITLETIAILAQMGITSQLGIGNSGANMPAPRVINLAYLLGAMSWGLDCAFINPAIENLISSVRSMDMLTERDPQCRRYLKQWRESQ